jgi:uncharacterized membrane protein
MDVVNALLDAAKNFRIEHVHPILIHYPLALLVTSLIFYLIARIKNSKPVELIGLANLITGTLISYAAVYSGLLAEEAVKHSGIVHEIVELHEKLGYGVAGVYTVLSLWGWLSYRRPASKVIPLFLIVLMLATALLAAQGYVGGYLVYEAGLGVKK